MKSNSKLALVVFFAALACFAAYRFTDVYAFFIGAIALLLVGVGLTPRNPNKKK